MFLSLAHVEILIAKKTEKDSWNKEQRVIALGGTEVGSPSPCGRLRLAIVCGGISNCPHLP